VPSKNNEMTMSFGGNYFFHRKDGRWRMTYRDNSGKGKLPPRSIVLSLASCTGYSASQFGA